MPNRDLLRGWREPEAAAVPFSPGGGVGPPPSGSQPPPDDLLPRDDAPSAASRCPGDGLGLMTYAEADGSAGLGVGRAAVTSASERPTGDRRRKTRMEEKEQLRRQIRLLQGEGTRRGLRRCPPPGGSRCPGAAPLPPRAGRGRGTQESGRSPVPPPVLPLGAATALPVPPGVNHGEGLRGKRLGAACLPAPTVTPHGLPLRHRPPARAAFASLGLVAGGTPSASLGGMGPASAPPTPPAVPKPLSRGLQWEQKTQEKGLVWAGVPLLCPHCT